MKKWIGFLLTAAMLLCGAPQAFASDHLQAYWPLHDEYNTALASGDADRIISAVQAIEALYAQRKMRRSARP